MPGFMPGIPVSLHCRKQDVDGRDKPGHDVSGELYSNTPGGYFAIAFS
jgi:hypothetical protein